MPDSAYWRCPICLRRVPDKVAECYCGRRRQAGDGPDESDQPKTGGVGPLLALGALLGAGALTYVTIVRQPPPTVVLAPPPSTQAAPVPGRPFAPVVTPHPENTMRADWTPPPPPTQPPTPKPAETAAALADGVDARRDAGRRAFEAAAQNLQGRMDVVRHRIENLARSCPEGSTQVRGCDGLRRDLERDASGLREIAEQAQDDARRSWVDPGFVREVRDRYEIREGDVSALLARVDEALKR